MSKLTISIGLVLVVLALRVERAATFPTSLEKQQQHRPQHQLLQQLWSRVSRDQADSLDNQKHHLSNYLSVSLSFETFQEIQTYHYKAETILKVLLPSEIPFVQQPYDTM